MNIPVQFMRAEGEFSVPGTRTTVKSRIVRGAIGRLPMEDHSKAFNHIACGDAPSEKIAEALRQLFVELAGESSERDIPIGTSRSHP